MLIRVRLKQRAKRIAARLSAVTHPHRLAAVYLLAHDALRVRDLGDRLNLPENLVAHHVKIMAAADLVRKERIGRNIFYHLNEKAWKEIDKEMKNFLGDTPFFRSIFAKPAK